MPESPKLDQEALVSLQGLSLYGADSVAAKDAEGPLHAIRLTRMFSDLYFFNWLQGSADRMASGEVAFVTPDGDPIVTFA